MSQPGGRVISEIAGVGLIALTVFMGISLLSHNPSDPSFNSYFSGGAHVKNHAGIIGAVLSDGLVQVAGMSAWLLPLGFLYAGVTILVTSEFSRTLIWFWLGLLILLISLAGMSGLSSMKDPLYPWAIAGGMMGQLVASKLAKPFFGSQGSYVVLVTVIPCSILAMFRISFSSAIRGVTVFLWKIKLALWSMGRVAWPYVKRLFTWRPPLPLETPEVKSIREKKNRIREKKFIEEAGIELAEEPLPPAIIDFEPDVEPPVAPVAAPVSRSKKKDTAKPKEEAFQQEIFRMDDEADYEFPSIKLLDSEPKTAPKQSKDELIKTSRILEKKLLDFGIQGRVTQVSPGPVITVYEFEPAPGVKVSRIVALADDLAMSMRAMSIRVLAPIPGKSVVGVEVPNPVREAVYLKEILSSDEYNEGAAKIPLALGRDVSGKPIVADLASVPHLLIAGSTGSGKSVGVNGMICSILYNSTPSDIKFIMIDPKMLELSIYDGIPHLIAPVVTNPKKAANALRWVVGEMERRYALLSELGVRNIDGYNKMAKQRQEDELLGKAPKPVAGDANVSELALKKLPYIVVIIDELADLMMVSSKEVEDALARLAQMARAAGIHLIVATQRPSVDVLTGLIKANFPARISFQVRSRVDSRTIIDGMGAEKLLGKGDMLYLPPGASKMMRIQGPFVSDAEIHRIVNFLKGQRKPEYNEDILKAPPEDGSESADEEDMDEFYDKAVELVATTRQVSISMIQRRLRIGYNRAARIVEVMEKQGLIGPADGAKPREVYARAMGDVESYN